MKLVTFVVSDDEAQDLKEADVIEIKATRRPVHGGVSNYHMRVILHSVEEDVE